MSATTLSRRGALLGATCLFGCATGTHSQTVEAKFQCTDLAASPLVTLSPAEMEMHGIFLLLSMALVFDGWGVDQRKAEQVAAYAAEEPGRKFADYLGHNVGALLIGRESNIICFALNRNVQFNSTMEHAEARSVRTGIKIANAAEVPSGNPSWTFGNLLKADRLYTTLEPCSQCAGTIALANIGSIIYGQDDPGQKNIVNVLYNLHSQTGASQARTPQPGAFGAALPVRASFFPLWDELDLEYRRFAAAAQPGGMSGLTAFLAIVPAYRIYKKAAALFANMREQHAPNAAVLTEAQAFRARWQGSVQNGLIPS
jgi:tRNA(Arg) A34 adenosine deaminase TadA